MKNEWDYYTCEGCPFVLTIKEPDGDGGVLISNECTNKEKCREVENNE